MDNDFQWRLKGRCYKLGHDVPHAARDSETASSAGDYSTRKDIVRTCSRRRSGFPRALPTRRHNRRGPQLRMGPKMNGYIAMQALGMGLVCESMPFSPIAPPSAAGSARSRCVK